MKHFETVEIPATKETRVTMVTCDLCGQEITQTLGNAERVEVSYTTGSIYPEGGRTKETGVDMCGKCFETKLVPWLRSQGVEPLAVEHDL